MKTNFFLITLIFLVIGQMKANNMLVKNVTTTGDNAANKTIQVQFDMSWDNSWRDGINWDAAWVFMKYKDANGLWQHVQLNTTGFANGTGTANTIQVGSDKVGAFVYRSAAGTGTFSSTTMQLQWNYGLSGLTSVSGLEIRVFAVEMVYVPEGDFNCAKSFSYSCIGYLCGSGTRQNGLFNAPGSNFPVINNKLSPSLTYYDGSSTSLRIKGDAGLDTDNNGTIDNTSYPTGFRAFYCYKYEMTEQQYTDFLNTLTPTQISSLGVAGGYITLSNGYYFSSQPNYACAGATALRLTAYADWSGVRPISTLEFNKVSYGPNQPIFVTNGNNCKNCANGGSSCKGYLVGQTGNGVVWCGPDLVGKYANSNSDRSTSGASYYGVIDLSGNVREPLVKLSYFSFDISNGNGDLPSTGNTDVASWNNNNMFVFVDQMQAGSWTQGVCGFRYVRTAE